MKTKLIYTALIGLLASSGISNAMDNHRLAITDGSGSSSSQMASYQGGNKVLTAEAADFKSASKEIFEQIVELPNGGVLGIQATCQYAGTGRQVFGNFMDDL
jgi:hypothetical protein